MRVVMTGGGSGGHIYPALAIADKVMEKSPESEIIYIGGKIGMEKDIVSKTSYPFKSVSSRWVDRIGNKFIMFFQLIWTGIVTFFGMLQAYGIMRKFKPDVVVGTGGFVCVPVVLAGKLYGADTYIHEQNAFPGLANRLLSKYVKGILLGFKDASDVFGYSEKQVYVGNPVRKCFYELDRLEARKKLGIPEDDFTVFSFGGSQGADTLNKIAFEYLKKINGKEGKTLIFGTGAQYYDTVHEKLKEEGIEISDNIRILDYISDMENYLAAADLVVSRAGALSLAEITVTGRASILVPFPLARDNHQYYNAKAVADVGGAVIFEEKDLDTDKVVSEIIALSENREKQELMEEKSRMCGPFEATDKIYEVISKIK